MNSDESRLFRVYFEKAENVVRDRNNFFALFFSALVAIFIPLTLTEFNPVIYLGNVTGTSNISTYNFVVQFTNNRVSSTSNWWISIFTGIIVFIVLTYLFFELKYREYRKNYHIIQIKTTVGHILKTSSKSPTTYNELCYMIEKRTLFSAEHIMPILKELYPPPKE